MHYRVLATDYDGTLAHDGHVSKRTLAALNRLREAGHKLLLVTGREIPDLRNTFAEVDVFDLVVAENGALLYWPVQRQQQPLADPPPPEFLAEVRRRGVTSFSQGCVIFATWRPHEVEVSEVIRQMGLDYQIIFNKRAVMVLPSGINKASGLQAALDHLQLESQAVVGVGDAENDHALLNACGFSVAVANALPTLKEMCDYTTQADHGDGVIELIDRWLLDAGGLFHRHLDPDPPGRAG